MTVLNFFRRKQGKPDTPSTEAQSKPTSAETTPSLAPVNFLDIDISPGDPFLAYCQSVGNVIEVDRLDLDSPALHVAQLPKS